jgi:hypothetical protein
MFTLGKYAKAICDRCGDKIKYQSLRKEWTGFLVCRSCWEPKTALEFPSNFPTDPEALKEPRPDNDIEATNGHVYIDGSGIGTGFKLKETKIELGTVSVLIV